MKRIVFLSILLLLTVNLMQVSGESNFIYEKTENDEVMLTGYSHEYMRCLKIPEKINDRKVTKIKEGAFCDKNIEELILPEGLKQIGSKAFANNRLTAVFIPSSVTGMAISVFEGNQVNPQDFLLIGSSNSEVESYALLHNHTFKTVGEYLLDQQVNFTDDNLRENISQILNLQRPVTRRDMLELSSLRLEEINNLTGLEYAKNLVTLELKSCEPNLENITNLKNLTSLRLVNYYNDWSSVSQLTQLEKLAIENSLVFDISPIKSLNELRELDLKNNYISDLTPLMGLTKLQKLNLESNAVCDILDLVVLKDWGGFSEEGALINLNDNFLDTMPDSFTTMLIGLLIKGNVTVDCQEQKDERQVSKVIISMDNFLYEFSTEQYIQAKASEKHVFKNGKIIDISYVKGAGEYYSFNEYFKALEMLGSESYKALEYLHVNDLNESINSEMFRFD